MCVIEGTGVGVCERVRKSACDRGSKSECRVRKSACDRGSKSGCRVRKSACVRESKSVRMCEREGKREQECA